jgi:O-antigen ligase
MSTQADVDRWSNRLFMFLLILLVGIVACTAAVFIADMTKKKLMIVAAAGAAVFLAGYTGRARELLLIGWTVALTYGRMYYSFDRFFGNNGSQGLYWIPADALFAGLLGLWAYDALILRRTYLPMGPSTWQWTLPFMIACVLSSFGAQMMNWALFETVRVLKFALLLYYFRYNLTPKAWRLCIWGLAIAVLLQATYGTLQVVTQGRFASFFSRDAGAEVLDLQAGQESQWHRAAGTMGHPNILAPYMMLLSPMFAGLAFASREKHEKIVFGATAMIGFCAAVLSLSRIAWLLTAFEIFLLAVALVVTRTLTAKRALGLGVVSLLLASIAMAPFADKIEKRLTGDFSESIKFRARHDARALEIFERSPIFGIGLSNYLTEMVKYEPDMDKFLLQAEIVRVGIGIRVICAVHNLYLLILSETGFVGFISLLWFMVGVGMMAYRAVSQTKGKWQVAMVGLAIGCFAVSISQFSEFSLWVDPVFYTFALVVALFNTAPAATRDEPSPISE